MRYINVFFFFNDTATTEIYTLSLHDALPISDGHARDAPGDAVEADLEDRPHGRGEGQEDLQRRADGAGGRAERSEEHTSELQSRQYLVCRLLLEKKIKSNISNAFYFLFFRLQ